MDGSLGDDLTTQNFNRGVLKFCEDFGLLGALASYIWYIGLDRSVAYDRQTLQTLELGNPDFMFVPSKRKLSLLWRNFSSPQPNSHLSPSEPTRAKTPNPSPHTSPHPDSYQPYHYRSHSPKPLYNSRPYHSTSQRLQKNPKNPKKSKSTGKKPFKTAQKKPARKNVSSSVNNLESASVGNSGILDEEINLVNKMMRRQYYELENNLRVQNSANLTNMKYLDQQNRKRLVEENRSQFFRDRNREREELRMRNEVWRRELEEHKELERRDELRSQQERALQVMINNQEQENQLRLFKAQREAEIFEKRQIQKEKSEEFEVEQAQLAQMKRYDYEEREKQRQATIQYRNFHRAQERAQRDFLKRERLNEIFTRSQQLQEYKRHIQLEKMEQVDLRLDNMMRSKSRDHDQRVIDDHRREASRKTKYQESVMYQEQKRARVINRYFFFLIVLGKKKNKKTRRFKCSLMITGSNRNERKT
jgi:hypothetical protein